MSDINLLAQSIFSQFTNIGNMYLGSVIFGGVIALFIFRKVVDVINKLRP